MGYDVGDVARLTAEFRTGPDPGILADPQTVTARWRRPNGVVPSAVPAVQDSVGKYHYDLELDAAGDWAYEIRGVGGDAQGVQSDMLHVRESLVDSTGALTLVPVGAVAAKLRRPLTPAETDAAENAIEELIALLEIRWNRDLIPRTYVDEVHVADPQGRAYPYHGPVASVQAITVDSWPFVDAGGLADWESLSWYQGARVLISYTTRGLDPSRAYDVRGLIANAVARGALSTAAVSTGAVRSYSVEGTSITYGDAGAGGSEGPISVGDLKGVNRRLRPVLIP